MSGHTYDKDDWCIKCGCKRDDSFYGEGTDCPYDAWADNGYTSEEHEE